MRQRWLVDAAEVDFTAIRAQGAGGQNVNKVSSAAHLRFDIAASSLPAEVQAQLRAWPDQRITAEGVVVIKAQGHRSLPRNQADALQRLQDLVDQALQPVKARKATKPTLASQRRRLQSKSSRSQTKLGRRQPSSDDA